MLHDRRQALAGLVPSFLLTGLFILSAGALHAATKTAASSGNWSTPSLWSPSGVPANNDDVVIPAGRTVTLNVNSANLASVTIESGATLQGDGVGRLLSWGRGTGEDFRNDGTLLASGTRWMIVRLTRNSQWGGTGVFQLSTLDLGGRTLSFSAGSSFTISLSTAPNPIITAGTIQATEPVTWSYEGTAAQNIIASANVAFHHLRIANPAGVTLLKSLTTTTLAGDLLLAPGALLSTSNGSTAYSITGKPATSLVLGAGARLRLGSGTSTVTQFPTGFGTLTLDPTSTVEYGNAAGVVQSVAAAPAYGQIEFTGVGPKTLPAGELLVTGDWTNNSSGTFTVPSGSTVRFAGSGAQSVAGVTVTPFGSLAVEKASGSLALGIDASVRDTLQLISGMVQTNSSTLSLLSGGTVVRGTGHVTGSLRKPVSAGSPLVSFELGSAVSYLPVSVQFSGSSTAGSLAIRTLEGDHPSLPLSDLAESLSVNRYWSLTPSGLLFDSARVAVSYEAADLDPGADPNRLSAQKFDGASWNQVRVGSADSTSAALAGLTSFSDLVLAQAKQRVIVASASVGGSISPSGAVVVHYNGSQSFTATPATGYHLDSLVVDGVDQGPLASYTFSNVTSNHTIAAYFSIDLFTITASASAGGSISPSGSVVVNHDGSQSFTATPATGYHLDSLVVDGVDRGAVASYTFSNVTSNHTIAAYFSIDQFTITASASAGGSISPSGSVVVNYDGSQSFTATPSTGYHLDSLVVDGVDQGAIASYTLSNVTANHTIAAYFSIDQFTIAASASAGGSISPNGPVLVNYDGSQSFAATPSTGYHLDSLVVDGVDQGAVASYTFSNVTSNHTIAAYFSIDQFTITASASAGGSISPSGSVVVNYDGSQSFTATPNTGYHLDSLVVDGVDQGAVASYTFSNVTTNHAIAAYFSIDQFTISASSSAGGSISPSGSVVVNYDGSQSFTATPSTGYHLDSLVVDGVDQGAIASYTFSNVTANHTIAAYFSIDQFTITASASAGGSISPSGSVVVNYDGSQSFTATPSTGYHLDSLVVDGVDRGAVASYTFSNVTANHTIAAYFSIDQFTIAASASAGGSISPNGPVLVNYDGSQSFTATPSTGYHLDSVVVDGANQGAVGSYTFSNVTTNHAIAAYFSIDQFTITASASAGGSISPSGSVVVNYDGSQSFTATPATGYHLDSLVVDGVDQGAMASYTFSNVIANHSIAAYFSIDQFTITASASAGGSISPSGSVVVNYDGSQSFTATPSTGYHLDSLVVDGVNQGAGASYTFSNVTSNHTIAAYFSIDQFTITASASAGGSISPIGSVVVNYDGSQSFAVTPSTGYHLDSLVVDGVDQGAIASYTFSNVTSNHTIAAYFSIDQFTISASASAGGSISPSGSVVVNYDGSQSFTATPSTGYHLDSLVVDGVDQGAVASYTFSNVTSNHSIGAYFSIDQFTITASASAGGSISPSGSVLVNYDGSQSFAVTPSTGYHLDSLVVDGVDQGAIASYTFSNVTANHTILAWFSRNLVTVTADIAAGWNLVSAPVRTANPRALAMFPPAISPAYAFAGVYQERDSLRVGEGYWMEFPSAAALPLTGLPVEQETLSVAAGWNLLGSITRPIPVHLMIYSGTNPVSPFYDYRYGYRESATLTPGRGFWVKMSSAGQVLFPPLALRDATEQRAPALPDPPAALSVTLGDAAGNMQALFLAPASAEGAAESAYELPPVPPSGIFDVRFGGNTRMRRLQQAGSDEVVVPVQLQGLTPPVRITWHAPEGWEREVIAEWSTGSQTGRTELQGTTGAASWPVAPGAVLLRVQPPVHAYLLAQNYPNPFNPETEIRFEVPAATRVRVAVYNALGQQVAVLSDGEVSRGVHRVRFDAAALGTGVYFVRLESPDFTATRKMLYMK